MIFVTRLCEPTPDIFHLFIISIIDILIIFYDILDNYCVPFYFFTKKILNQFSFSRVADRTWKWTKSSRKKRKHLFWVIFQPLRSNRDGHIICTHEQKGHTLTSCTLPFTVQRPNLIDWFVSRCRRNETLNTENNINRKSSFPKRTRHSSLFSFPALTYVWVLSSSNLKLTRLHTSLDIWVLSPFNFELARLHTSLNVWILSSSNLELTKLHISLNARVLSLSL